MNNIPDMIVDRYKKINPLGVRRNIKILNWLLLPLLIIFVIAVAYYPSASSPFLMLMMVVLVKIESLTHKANASEISQLVDPIK